MTAYEQLGTWVNDSFGEAKQQATDLVLTSNTTVLELGPGLNISYVSIMEDQHQGQTIWGWTLEGRRGGKWSELTHGGSIGHKRIISCSELSPSDRVAGVDAERARVEDPPAPPPQPSDVLFTHCDSANSWLVEGGGQIRNANRSSPSACLTVSQRHLPPFFPGHFSPVLRGLFAVLLRFPASWRQDGENGRKMA